MIPSVPPPALLPRALRPVALCALALCLAFPTRTRAASEVCDAIANIEPVSRHYVKKVLERADAGIVQGLQDGQGDIVEGFDLLFVFDSYVQSVEQAWSQVIDARLRLQDASVGLKRDTACLRLDKLKIQCKMEEVGKELEETLKVHQAGMLAEIMDLSSVLQFLQQSETQLAIGAMDPMVTDVQWGRQFFFEENTGDVVCGIHEIPGEEAEDEEGDAPADDGDEGAESDTRCARMTAEQCKDKGDAFESFPACGAAGFDVRDEDLENATPEQLPMCPFDSDYLEPVMRGYGCDETAMEGKDGLQTLRREREALERLTRNSDEYAARQHKRAYGCGARLGLCSLDPQYRCAADSDCADRERGWCDFPPGRCSGNTLLGCYDDANCSTDNAGTCLTDLATAAVPRFTLFGPFSGKKDVWGLLRSFLDLSRRQGADRQFADELKTSAEFRPDQSAYREEVENDYVRMLTPAGSWRQLAKEWSTRIGRERGFLFPIAVDPESDSEGTSLRKEARRLARLAHDRDKGLRRMLIDFAYFLRRSCIQRPCIQRLEQVMKIAFADECFPFTQGDFLADAALDADGNPEDPRWKKCMRAACIELEGVDPEGEYAESCSMFLEK